MSKTNTPREAATAYFEAWKATKPIEMWASLHPTAKFQITAASLFAKLLKPPVSFEIYGEEDIVQKNGKLLDCAIIRDIQVKLDFGTGERLALVRCLCEGVKNEHFAPMSTVKGGTWGVNPASIRFLDEENGN